MTVGQDAVPVCRWDEVPEGGALRVEVHGEPVAVVRAGGDLFALRDVCSHAEVPLSEGDVEDCRIECWLHGSTFDLRTGKPSGLPATEPVPVYTATVQGDQVMVTLSPPPSARGAA